MNSRSDTRRFRPLHLTTLTLALALPLTSAFITGCDDTEPPAAAPESGTGSATPGTGSTAPASGPGAGESSGSSITSQLNKGLSDAAKLGNQLVNTKSQEWLDASQKRVDELNQKIADLTKQLNEQAAKLSDTAKQRYQQLVLDLQEQKSELLARWESAKTAGGEAWAEARIGFEAALATVNEAIKVAQSRLVNPPSPETPAPVYTPGAVPEK
jgi:hypothetical protein